MYFETENQCTKMFRGKKNEKSLEISAEKAEEIF